MVVFGPSREVHLDDVRTELRSSEVLFSREHPVSRRPGPVVPGEPRRLRGISVGWTALLVVLLSVAVGSILMVVGRKQERSFPYSFVSRDGSRSVVWLRDRQGSLCALSPGSVDAYAPAWKPDGTQLAFVTASPTKFEIRIVGDGLGSVVTSPGPISSVEWSPDGEQLLFDRASGPEGPQQIIVHRLPDDAERVLLTLPLRRLGRVSWRPGSQQLAYGLIDPAGESHLVVFDGATGKVVRTTQTPDTSPAWSRDGKKMAFVRHVGSEWSLMVANADGSDERQLLRSSRLLFNPAWTADDSKLVFEQYIASEPAIFLIDSKGGTTRHLAAETNGQPAPQPHGDRTLTCEDAPRSPSSTSGHR